MRLIRLFFAIVLLFSPAVLPAQTIRKVLVEEYTGAWCGGCPAAAIAIEDLEHDYPDHTIGLAWHEWDDLEIADWTPMKTLFGITSYPGGAVDRYKFPGTSRIIMSHLSFPARFLTRKNTPAIVSVGLRDLVFDGSAYHFTVDASFSQQPTAGAPLRVNVIIKEDSIPAIGSLEQTNYYSTIQNGNNPLVNWFHNETARRCLGGTWGVVGGLPPVVSTGVTYSSDFSFIPDPAWNLDQLHVLALVSYAGDTALNQREVLNVETVRLRDWLLSTSVQAPARDPLQVQVSPNPVSRYGRAEVAYAMPSTGTVRFTLFNALGEMAVEPATSYEVAGRHSWQWSPRGLPAGIYQLRIETEDGFASTHRLVVAE